MARRYVPARGNVIWIAFNPQAGHEQAGRRPALVLSPSSYNGKVGLAILCPVTSQVKGYPFEVMIPSGSKQVFSLRQISFRITSFLVLWSHEPNFESQSLARVPAAP